MPPEEYHVLVSWYWNVPVLIRYEAALGAEGGTDPGSLFCVYVGLVTSQAVGRTKWRENR